jgi:F-type H+-transporting ATPase subunit b
MARALLLAAVLFTALAPSLAFAEGGGHGHGPLTFKSIVDGHSDDSKQYFWGATLNFALLLFVLYKLAGKGIKEGLHARRATMEAAINEAAEMKAKAEAKHEELSKRLATLDAELEKLKTDLQRAAEDDKKRIQAEADESAKRLRADTESLIEQHASALSADVRREVVEAAIVAAQQVIAQSVGPADQQKLADGFRERIQAIAARAPRTSRPVAGGPS